MNNVAGAALNISKECVLDRSASIRLKCGGQRERLEFQTASLKFGSVPTKILSASLQRLSDPGRAFRGERNAGENRAMDPTKTPSTSPFVF